MLCSQKPIKAQFIKTNRCALIWIFSIQSTVFYFSVLKISKPTFQQCCQMSRILSKTHVLLIEVNQGTIDLHKAMFMKTDLTKFGQKISYFSVLELSKSSFRLCHQKSGSLKQKHARLIEFNQCTIHVHKPICIDLAFFTLVKNLLFFRSRDIQAHSLRMSSNVKNFVKQSCSVQRSRRRHNFSTPSDVHKYGFYSIWSTISYFPVLEISKSSFRIFNQMPRSQKRINMLC